MNEGLKVYDSDDVLIIDSNEDYYDYNRITRENLSSIFRTDINKLKIYDKNGVIVNAHIANATAKIANAAIGTAQIAASSVTNGVIVFNGEK